MFDGPFVGADVPSVDAEVELKVGALDGIPDGEGVTPLSTPSPGYERLPPPQKQHATHQVDFE